MDKYRVIIDTVGDIRVEFNTDSLLEAEHLAEEAQAGQYVSTDEISAVRTEVLCEAHGWSRVTMGTCAQCAVIDEWEKALY